MSNKVVGIKSHPKYRDTAALRVWLNGGGQGQFGTPVDMTRFIDSDNPEIKSMLSDLNSWCESLKDLGIEPTPAPTLVEMSKLAKIVDKHTPVDFSHYTLTRASNVGKSIPTGKLLAGLLEGGLKKGDFYNHAAVPPMPLDSPTPLHHMSRNQNHVTLNNRFMIKEPTDANPST